MMLTMAIKHTTPAQHLKKIHQSSPLHWWFETQQPPVKKKAFDIGTAFHTAVLEPEKFSTEIIICPEFNLRTNAGKENAAEFEAAHPGKVIINAKEEEQVMLMKRSVIENEFCTDLLLDGMAEVSHYTDLKFMFGDTVNSMPVKIKPDWITNGKTIVADLKSCQDASPEGFAKDAAGMRYDMQAAFYLDVLSQFTGKQEKDFYFIAVEKAPPYAMAVYKVPQEVIAEGRFKYRKAMKMLQYCLNAERWFSYEIHSMKDTGVLDLNLPGWGYDKILFTKYFEKF